jgi:alpha-1,6-mannosyltransferase
MTERKSMWLGVAATVAIVASILVMLITASGGPNVSLPAVHGAAHPPWWHPLHLTATATIVSMWAALVLGCAGVIAGLAAVARGFRIPAGLVLGFAFVAVALLTVLPPAGSTDAMSYAANGRMAVIGHSPYVMTPAQLKNIGDPIGRQLSIPSLWNNTVSVYGPVATGAEWVAARLGGTSLAHITFWLKLLEALCFGAVACVLDRMLRNDPARRLRAHLLWTVNPLLLWEIVASGHIDGLSAMFGLLGIVALRQNLAPSGAAVAGVCIGLAAGVKVEYALFGLAVAWACRRSAAALAAAAAGFAVVTLPAYLLAGTPAVKVLFTRSGGITSDTLYQLFWRPVLGYTAFDVHHVPPHLVLVSYLLFAAVAVLAMVRMPDRTPGFPALSPALGLSLAWLFVTGFQRPWYDVMALSLLALYAASLLDWVVLIRLLAGGTAYVVAVDNPAEPHWLHDLYQFNGTWLVPAVLLLAAIALVWMCVKSYPQEGPVDSAHDNVAGSKLPLAT